MCCEQVDKNDFDNDPNKGACCKEDKPGPRTLQWDTVEKACEWSFNVETCYTLTDGTVIHTEIIDKTETAHADECCEMAELPGNSDYLEACCKETTEQPIGRPAWRDDTKSCS